MSSNIEIVNLPPHVRSAAVRANTYNADANTIEICFTTGADVLRSDWLEGDYIERLETGPDNVKLDRLNAGAAFLDTHNAYQLGAVIGAVVPGSARMEGGKGLCTVKLSKSARSADTVTDLRDGVINNISVGYDILAFTRVEASDGIPAVMTATLWEPCEISAVPVPADPGAQVRAAQRSSAGVRMTPCKITRASPAQNQEAAMADEPNAVTEKVAADNKAAADKALPDKAASDKAIIEKAGLKEEDVVKVHETPADTVIVTEPGHKKEDPGDALPVSVQRKLQGMVSDAVAGERSRINEIRTIAKRHGLDKLAAEHAERGTAVVDFKEVVLEALAKRFEEGGPVTGQRSEESLQAPKGNVNALVDKARALGLGKK
jgi:phage head maturation protease